MDEGLMLLKEISRSKAKAILQDQVEGDLIADDLKAILSALDQVENSDQHKWKKLLNASACKLNTLKKFLTKSTREFEKRTRELDKMLEPQTYSKPLPDEYRRQAAYNIARQNESELWILGSLHLSDKQLRKYVRKQSKLKEKNKDSLLEDTMLSDSDEFSDSDDDILNQSFIEDDEEESELENTEHFKLDTFIKLQKSEENINIDASEIMNTKDQESDKLFVERNESEASKNSDIFETQNDKIPETNICITSEELKLENTEVLETINITPKQGEITQIQEVNDNKLDEYINILLEIHKNDTESLKDIENFELKIVETASNSKTETSTISNAEILEENLSDTLSSMTNNSSQESFEINEKMNKSFQRYPQYLVNEQLQYSELNIEGKLNHSTQEQSDISVLDLSCSKSFSNLNFHDVKLQPQNREVISSKIPLKQTQILDKAIYNSPLGKFRHITKKAEITKQPILDNSEDLNDEDIFYDCIDEIVEVSSMGITTESSKNLPVLIENMDVSETGDCTNKILDETCMKATPEINHSMPILDVNKHINVKINCMDGIFEENSIKITPESSKTTPVLDTNKHDSEKRNNSNKTETLTKHSPDVEKNQQSEVIKTDNNNTKFNQSSIKVQDNYFDTPKKRPIFKRKELPLQLRPPSQIAKEMIDAKVKEIYGKRRERSPSHKRALPPGIPKVRPENKFPEDHVYTPKRWRPDFLANPYCTVM